MRRIVLVSLVVLVVGTSGCADGLQKTTAGPAETSTSVGSTTVVDPVTETSATGSSLPVPTGYVTADAGCTASTTTVSGSVPRYTWGVVLPQVSGCDSSGGTEFNRAMMASLQDQIGFTGDPTTSDPATVTSDGGCTLSWITRTALAGLVWTQRDFEGEAHPSFEIGSVVIDRATGRPITLGDLFPDEQAGLRRLHDLMPRHLDLGDGRAVAPDNPGIAPNEASFATWQPIGGGIEIIFGDYQIDGHGILSAVVPWPELQDVVSPSVFAILSS